MTFLNTDAYRNNQISKFCVESTNHIVNEISNFIISRS